MCITLQYHLLGCTVLSCTDVAVEGQIHMAIDKNKNAFFHESTEFSID